MAYRDLRNLLTRSRRGRGVSGPLGSADGAARRGVVGSPVPTTGRDRPTQGRSRSWRLAHSPKSAVARTATPNWAHGWQSQRDSRPVRQDSVRRRAGSAGPASRPSLPDRRSCSFPCPKHGPRTAACSVPKVIETCRYEPARATRQSTTIRYWPALARIDVEQQFPVPIGGHSPDACPGLKYYSISPTAHTL